MSKQTINLGAATTGVGGDTPRSAFTKAQANFDELYAKFLNYGLDIPLALSNPNLNAVSTFGFYYVAGATNAPPADGSGYLLVYAVNTSYICQQFTSTGYGYVWTRSCVNGTWTTWGRLYNTANILGTVSNSGGLPTGAIIQQDTNANGFYTRWADGTQICTSNNASLLPAAAGISTVTWVFPIPFVSTPNFSSLTANVGAGSDVRNYVGQATYSNISTNAIVFTTYMLSVVGCYACAIGRWY